MKQSKVLIKFILINIFILSTLSYGQITKNELIQSNKISIESKLLNEERDFYIYLPEEYGQSNKRYPVLYVLDGETNFFISSAITSFMSYGRNGQIPQMIVVGIPNVARMRDFTPIADQKANNSGGADNFIKFLDQELIKYINQTYRTNDYRILFGHSLCGMFSVYTLFTYPNLFNAHISASPYLMMSDDYVIKNAEQSLNNNTIFENQLYISIGDEPAYYTSLEKFTELLEKKQPGINWTLNNYSDENHNSIPFRTIADGLKFIFSDWQLSDEIVLMGVDSIKSHVNNCYLKYDTVIDVAEGTLNRIGYQLLQENEFKKAIEIFEYNTTLYPESANVYDSLGDAYDAHGFKEKALINYKKAVSIGMITNDPNLSVFQNNVKRLITNK